MPIEQCQLIQEHRPESEPLSGRQAARRDWPMSLKDACELFIEILNRQEAGFVQNAAHFHAGVGMGVRMAFAGAGGDQDAALLGTEGFQFAVAVVLIAQEKAQFLGEFPNERGSLFVVCRIRSGQVGGQRGSHGGGGTDEMQFPAVHLAMPAGFGPPGFGINRHMRDHARFMVGLVPDPAAGAQHCAVYRGGAPTCQPRLD